MVSAAQVEDDQGCCPICYEEFDQDEHCCDDGHKGSPSLMKASKLNDKQRITTGGCNHSFCRACLRDYCQHEILNRKTPIRCPHRTSTGCQTEADPVVDGQSSSKSRTSIWSRSSRSSTKRRPSALTLSSRGCATVLADVLVQDVLRSISIDEDDDAQGSSDAFWTKYQRNQRMKQDPLLVACPLCEELVGSTTPQPQDDDD